MKCARYEAVVIGVSAGGLNALEKILPAIPADYRLAVLIVQHMASGGGNYMIDRFSSCCRVPVRESFDKDAIVPGTIYFAPADYHLLVERQKSMALSLEAKVNYTRPSIDVLFTTAAEAYGDGLVGVILTGANADGAAGLAEVGRQGGLTVVQSPASAEVDIMPKAAIKAAKIDHVLPLDEIGPFLAALN